MDKNRPARVIRLGRIKVTVWANAGPHGPWYSARVCRVYKEGDTWKQSDSFGRDELPLVCKAMDLAHTWIYAQAGSPQGDLRSVAMVEEPGETDTELQPTH